MSGVIEKKGRGTRVSIRKDVGMEGWIAKWYAANTRRSLPDVAALAVRVAGRLPAGSRVLEVAPGPGYLAIELAKAGPHAITGLDISRTFVAMAERNAADAGVDVEFRRGDAASMPFGAESFDFIICRAAFKNFAKPVDALREMHRVLRRGGTALIIDLRRDASRDAIDAEVNRMGLGPVNAALTKWIFRVMLIRRAYIRDEFRQFISQSGFRTSEIREGPVGVEVSLVK